MPRFGEAVGALPDACKIEMMNAIHGLIAANPRIPPEAWAELMMVYAVNEAHDRNVERGEVEQALAGIVDEEWSTPNTAGRVAERASPGTGFTAPPSTGESQAEIQFRLGNEKRCRELGDMLKRELSPTMGFILFTCTTGSDTSFQSTSYVSTLRREDTLRQLSEFIDSQWSDGLVTEPSPRTCTALREAVSAIRGTPMHKLLTNVRHRTAAVSAAPSPRERCNRALTLAAEALAVFDIESRRINGAGGN